MELGLSAAGKPSFTLAGQDTRQLQRRLGFDGGKVSPLLIGGAVILTAGVAFLLFSEDDTNAVPLRRSPCPPGVEVCTQ